MPTTENPTAIPFQLRLTPAAADRVRQVVSEYNLPDGAGLKVGAETGGCSGLNYVLTVVPEPPAGDSSLEIDGVRVFVDDFSRPYLNGMTVDWISTMQESRFVFQNPNATGTCGCGISFTVDSET